MKAPVAKKIPTKLIKHGDERTDNYYWLNQRENNQVINYLEEENRYTDFMLQNTQVLQQKLYDEMVGRIKQTDMSVPYELNGYQYYVRYLEGCEYPVICRKSIAENANEEVMLDGNKMAEGLVFFHIGNWEVSPDNKLIAFTTDTVSRRQYTIRVKNLMTGEMVPEEIIHTAGDVTWANDCKTLFYTKKDETLRPYQILRHQLGTAAEMDVVIFEETDTTFRTFVYKTKSDKYLVIGSRSILSDEYRILEADNPTGEFRIFQERTENLEYSIYHQGDRFLLLTNHQALNFQLMQTPENKTALANWETLVGPRDKVFLEDVEVFHDFVVLTEREKGLILFRLMQTPSGSEHYLHFTETDYHAVAAVNPDYFSKKFRFHFTSLKTPNTVYDYDSIHRTQQLLKQMEVAGGYHPEDYITERCYAPARDGALVPISLVYKKDFKKDGSQPVLMYGYGSYGINMDSTFLSKRLSLLDRGFAYAIAHIRGSEELGREWYEDGKLLNKKNTFYDFIDCGCFLIEEHYTQSEMLFGYGGSAGGLLIGAVINMAPTLFKGVVAAVPFVDVVTTMLDESIPLTTGEYDEWGNPNEKAYYDYMLSYSPYDQVKKQDYPALLVVTGLHDSQVQYWEPAKWVAKLRELKTDENLLLLKTNMELGHGGASGRFEAMKDAALEYAFLLKELGQDSI
ncbi:MAG: S9 family peptidase [Bacteroidales bacterium]|nr:S9 family peptidase [Bacteroidales bacterium]